MIVCCSEDCDTCDVYCGWCETWCPCNDDLPEPGLDPEGFGDSNG